MTSRLAVVGHMAMRCNTGVESDVYECLVLWVCYSVIFINENENENGEKRENNTFVNES